ncbi:vitamin B12-dependent ribonucleotide reductase, partial [Candidatus Woesearchaeota archaeon]|nr:vitamin B12-dependent ribonucleotide reductase [Candidatus Woesearchaeota archaeon]
MVHMLINQTAAPNSPQWFTTGLHFAYGLTGPAQGHSYVDPVTKRLEFSKDAYSRTQPHACFIQKLDDDLVRDGGIFSLLTREARIFKYGSGSGSNFSRLRGKGEKLSGGGTSSGLMSFLKIFDVAAGSVKSGGTTRRAAKMVCLDLDHPDILDFIWWKVREEEKVAQLVAGSKILKQRLSKLLELARGQEHPFDEKKVRQALKLAAKSGIPLSYLIRALDLAKQGRSLPLREFDTHYESEAYLTVSGQNSNNSVRIPNDFFKAVTENKDWELKARTNGQTIKKIPAKDLWEDIAYCAWASADPGVQYDTTINEWHTSPANGRINGSNPCVTGDTKVLTKDGKWKRIDSILGQPTTIIVNTGFIQEVPISGSFKTGNKPIYKLTTKSGYELKLTADHKVFTLNREFVAACELCKDDLILLPMQEVAELKEIEDSTFYQMLGVYLGDGCGGKISSTRGIAFTMNKESETAILEKFAEYVALSYERITHRDSPALVQMTKTSAKYVITNQVLIKKIEVMLNLKLKSHEKCISEEIFALPLNAQRHIIQGLFTADGTVAYYPKKGSYYISLDSSSLQLLKDIQIMLLGFGIKSKIYSNRRAGKDKAWLPDGKGGLKEYSVQEMHSLRISRINRIKFGKLIGFMTESPKNEKLKLINQETEAYSENSFDCVDKLEYVGLEDVYDLTEPLTHTFIANGITVHNCSEYMYLDDTSCNLASINMVRFYDENSGKFDIAGYQQAIRLWTIALEISILMAQFPSEQIAINTYRTRSLGLGFANLGTLLMMRSLPYDSDEARALSGALAAILTGEAYATSAELAQAIEAFEDFGKNRESMLRVIRNHRRAAYSLQDYEGLSIKPMPIDEKLCPAEFLSAARDSWDRALSNGEKFGYRNAQVSVMAPTGTIGLVMDCDTTGVEPDYSIVKYKKLAGGGFFKIVNQSVPKALKNLGYNSKEIEEIISYCLGHSSFVGCPTINESALLQRGLNLEQISKVEKDLKNCMDINYLFNAMNVGAEFYNRITNNGEKNFLSALGFSEIEIEKANDYICGTMTLENAPHLKEEHYSVFDCANKCGKKGKRYIHPYGHLKMLSALQPFISGAISKTINMPNDWNIEQIKQAYYDAWTMMLKGVALYRDG